MSKRSQLRNRYYKETYKYWKTMNTTATPTIEYAKWLENIILDSERQTTPDAEILDNSEVLNIPFVNASFLPECTRVEVIDNKGRAYVNWKPTNRVRVLMQDDNRTLKIIVD